MGIIKATLSAIGGNLADRWLEVLEAEEKSDTTVFSKGVRVRRGDKRSSNKKGTEDTISNGSVIHVYPNQFMILVDGGKIVDYTAEEAFAAAQGEEDKKKKSGNEQIVLFPDFSFQKIFLCALYFVYFLCYNIY